MISLNVGEVLAELIRNDVVESQHVGHFVALDTDGSILLQKGDPTQLIYPRSSYKAVLASAMVRSGVSLNPRLLALTCSSHSGLPMHQEGVLEILRLAGLDERSLQNIKGKPLDEAAALATSEPTRLAMNCSGKHAGMLLGCSVNGWATHNYLEPGHRLQQAFKMELENLAGESVSHTAIDGCGAPLFLISLLGLARAIRAMTISTDPVHQSVVGACRSFPEMVAGPERMTSILMGQHPGLFMKSGAESIMVASIEDGKSFAFKVNDGGLRPRNVISLAGLRLLGIHAGDTLEKVYGGDHVVGSIRATF
ncbi:MAG: asparaginase [Candidatus Planktophila sp.]|nr:asparaginase [Candidatus Planktophila sp.]